MTYTSITHAGNDHSFWRKGLEFYEDDIQIMETRLAEVASKNNSFEARQGVEHFQNQFIVQRNNMDELNHEINLYVQKLGEDSQKHQGHIEMSMLADHDTLQQKYEVFEKIMNGIRHEFNDFLGKWM
ncbi:MAG: hypothetical protein JNM88_11915 [Chitinophagaceae bacterium]|nr:hypothetical protein [Chitinophagaceae bacterium]